MVDRAFIEHCLELFGSLGPVQAKRMFGGQGFYADDVMFALIAFETLYLRVDDSCKAAFESAGGEPFLYDSKQRGHPIAMPYYTVPSEAMDAPEAMVPFARLALEAARRAKAKATRNKRGAPAASQ